MGYFTIDRFEGSVAVCEKENRELIQIPISLLPAGCKEGSCLYSDKEGIYHIDALQQKQLEKRIKDLMDSLFE